MFDDSTTGDQVRSRAEVSPKPHRCLEYHHKQLIEAKRSMRFALGPHASAWKLASHSKSSPTSPGRRRRRGCFLVPGTFAPSCRAYRRLMGRRRRHTAAEPSSAHVSSAASSRRLQSHFLKCPCARRRGSLFMPLGALRPPSTALKPLPRAFLRKRSSSRSPMAPRSSLFLKKSALLHVRALDNAQAAQDATRLFELIGPNLETCTVNVFYENESVISRK